MTSPCSRPSDSARPCASSSAPPPTRPKGCGPPPSADRRSGGAADANASPGQALLLEELPDDVGGVDLEGGRPGDRRQGCADLAPRPGVATTEDDVELDGATSRAPVAAQDDVGGHRVIGGPRVAPVLGRPR